MLRNFLSLPAILLALVFWMTGSPVLALELDFSGDVTVSGKMDVLKGETPSPLEITASLSCSIEGESLPNSTTVTYLLKKDGVAVSSGSEVISTGGWQVNPFISFNYTADLSFVFELPEAGANATTDLQSGEYTLEVRALVPQRLGRAKIMISKESDPFTYAVFSGDLYFNDIQTSMESMDYNSSLCEGGGGLSSLNAAWQHDFGLEDFSYTLIYIYDAVTDTFVAYTPICTSQSDNGDGYSTDLAVTDGSVFLGDISFVDQGHDLSLNGVMLSSAGGIFDSAELILPVGVSVHHDAGGFPWPRGVDYLNFGGGSLSQSLSGLEFSWSDPLYFHDYGLPFYVGASGFSFVIGSGNGLGLNNPSSYFVHKKVIDDIDPADPRNKTGFAGNDMVFAEDGATGDNEVAIASEGMVGQLGFAGSDDHSAQVARTSFPRAQLTFSPWTLYLEDGLIDPKTILSDLSFTMDFRRNCPPGEVCENESDDDLYELVSDVAPVFWNGAMAAAFVKLGKETSWGGANDDGKSSFYRDDRELGGVWQVPGFIIMDSADTGANRRIAQTLFGALTMVEGEKIIDDFSLYAVAGTGATRGDGFFAGINMGPEILGLPGKDEQSEGFGSFLDDDLLVRFNGNNDYAQMGIRPYSKYLLRPAGLTGVFNTTFSSVESGPVNIYGYDINFSSFAFRQDRNNLEGKTLINGDLTLNGPVGGVAGMKIGFSNLALTCNGNLANGQVDNEPEPDFPVCNEADDDGDGLKDEGCYVLFNWNMPILQTGMAFADDGSAGEGECSDQPRKLQLATNNWVDGLGEILTMTAFYPPDGTLESQEMAGAIETVFDQPLEGSEPGFDLRLQTAYLNEVSAGGENGDGFMVLAGLSDVPLFNDARVMGHFVNNDPQDIDDFDLYVFVDETDNDSDRDGVPDVYAGIDEYRDYETGDGGENPQPYFEYYWPSPNIINLNYHADYQRASGSEMPYFKGVKKEADILGVLQISSVPDYINPERTRFSFGASADVAALTNASVDLSDISQIDDFLHSIGVDESFSLESMLTSLADGSEMMQDVTGGDLSGVFETVIDEVLVSEPLGPAIEDVADGLTLAHQAPSRITAMLIEPLNAAHEELVGQVTDELRTMLEELYNTYAQYVAYSPEALGMVVDAPLPDELAAMSAAVTDLHARLSGIISELEATMAVLEEALDGAAGAQAQLAEMISNVDDAIVFLDGLETNIDTELVIYLSDDPGVNPLLAAIDDAHAKVDYVRTQVGSVDIGAIADALDAAASLVGASIDTSLITSAEESINTMLNQLDSAISEAEDNLTGLYAVIDLEDILTPLLEMIGTDGSLQTSLNNLKGQLEAINNSIEVMLGSAQQVITAMNSSLTVLQGYLDNQFAEMDPATTWEEAKDAGQLLLDELAASLLDSLPATFPVEIDQDFIDVFVNNLETMLSQPFDELVHGQLEPALEEILEQCTAFLPNPTADDIRNMIKTAVLDTPAVQDLNEAFCEQFGYVAEMVDGVVEQLTTQIDSLIREAIAVLNESLNESLESVKAAIGADEWGVESVGVDGYAIVSQDEIEQIHLEAKFVMGGDPDPTSYYGALDVTSWNAENGKSGCVEGDGSFYDVVISTHDVSADMLGMDVGIKTASLGFSINDLPAPIGVFGNIYLLGELNFEALVLEDLGLESGIGLYELYFGATGAGRFQEYTIPKAAFFLGRSCDYSVLERLDSEVAGFIGVLEPLEGVYVRGSVQVPIYNYGCTFTIGVGADIGAWYFTEPDPGTYGGLVGGSAYGELGCLASLKGSVTCLGQKSGSQYKFSGSGWAGAGVGWCSPSSWDSVSDVRNDDWCCTGDATFGAEYVDDWEIDGPDINCCD